MRTLLFVCIMFLSTYTFGQRQVIVTTIIENQEFFDDIDPVSFDLKISNINENFLKSYHYSNVLSNPPGIKDDEVIEVPEEFIISAQLNLDSCPEDGTVWIRSITPENFHNSAVFTTGACFVNGYTYPFYIEPYLEVDNSFCRSKPLHLKSARGWQYQLVNEGNTWYNFGSNPNEQFVQPIPDNVHELSFEEISGDYDYIGPIRVRGSYSGVYSNVVQLNIIPCSPKLLEPIETFDTQCSDSNDGGFVAQFDRALLQNEELQITLYFIDDEDNEIPIAPTQKTEVLDENSSYTWPVELEPGTYYIRYQTVGGDYPASVVESNPFEVESPDEVTFSLTAFDANCNGGSDGSIKIAAQGGTNGNYQYKINGSNWVNFSGQNEHTVIGLPEGDYEIEIQDGNQCAGQADGVDEIHINQPQEPVSAELFQYVEPTAYGFTDGSITVDISGGTPYQNNSYDYTWYDEDDNLITTTSAQYVSNVYRITLENVTAGTYTLNISDANYSEADDIQGCILTQDFELIGPPELQLSIEETVPISCNSANIYSNPSNDGELTIIATGGVPFDPLIDGQYAYIYTWKKKVGPNNWQNIPNNGSNVLSNLEAGEFAVNIQDAHGIVIGTYVNNTLQQTNDVVYVLEEPELLTVQIEKTDINCFGGTDGTATAVVNGGTPPFEYFWSTGATSETAEGLWLGNHTIYVMDSRGCEAEAEVTIGQPDAPVSISNPQYVQPTAFGFTNGSITVQINGGTPLNNDSYNYEWRDAQNNIINTTFAEAIPDGYAIQAHDIPAGIYTFTVTDANYDNATQKEGCTYVAEFILDEPPVLELSVEQTIPISCNGENLFNNPSDDGQLLAISSGGVPFDPLINGQFAYIYTWKKKDDQNIWQTIPNVTGNILDNVDAGEYAVNIEDSNGIILGVYVNNMLEEPTDYEYPVQETDPIVLQMDKLDVSCYNSKDGWATVAIEGGMPPYDISWSSGAYTEIAENLVAGTYFVYVMDFYGCEVSAQVTIDQPEELTVSVIDIVSPTCFESEDGSLEVEILGGIPPYTYLWNVDEASLSLNNIGQGAYNLEVMDATGCTVSKEIILEAPFPTQVDLGGNRTLCNGQEYISDITINDPNAEYKWTSDNGFSSNSPKVTLSKPGIYTATVTNSLGCSGSDTIEITTTQIDIDSQFLITSQAFAGEDVVLVNTSNPIGTNEEWVFPVGMKVIEQEKGTVIVRFEEPGAYEVILRNYQGDCYQDITKSIIVAEAREHPDVGEAVTPFIKEFKVFPNPSSGTFTVVVSLQEASSASLRLFGLATNHIYDEQQLQDSAYYQVPYAMDLASGVYLLLLETAKGSEIRKIVIL